MKESNEKVVFSLHLERATMDLKKTRYQLYQLLKKFQIDANRQHQVVLVIQEMLVNLTVHPEVLPQEITIEFTYSTENVLVCKLKDNGSPFEGFERCLRAANIMDQLKENGRGLYLLKEYFHHVAYTAKSGRKFPFNMLSFAITEDAGFQFGKIRVAIIDDDPLVLKTLECYLSEHYFTESFLSGKAFLEQSKDINYGLVICDISLPEMDGFEVRQSMASNETADLIPFIFLTSNKNEVLETKASLLGIDDYVLKPITKKKLLSLIDRILIRKQADRVAINQKISRELTAFLNPSVPRRIRNYRLAFSSKVAATGGGDYLFHTEKEGHHYLCLGDVMGHGIRAKFYAQMYVGYLRVVLLALVQSCNIDMVMARFSDFIFHDPHLESIITTVMLLKLDDDRIEIVNGGHLLPLLVGPEGVEYIECAGPLPGVVDNLSYEKNTISLAQGQILVLMTDGLHECGKTVQEHERNKMKFYDLLKQCYQEHIEVIKEKLASLYDSLSEGMAYDDTTFVIIRREIND